MNTLQKLFTWDIRFLLWLHGKSQRRVLARLARNVSRCGDGHLYALAGGVAWWFGGASGTAFFHNGILAYLLELSLYLLIKNTIRRPRPNGLDGISALISPSDTFSFPSGHTAAAFVFATLCAVFSPVFAPFAFCGAILIGLSRVVLGVHYPSDIVAGGLLGTGSAITALTIAAML